MRQTSIQAYDALQASGALGRRQWQVYDTVYRSGPMTSSQAFLVIRQRDTESPIAQIRARFTELRDMGLFRECGEVVCSVTKRNVILWDVTDLQTPRKQPLTASRPTRQQLETRIAELEIENTKLREACGERLNNE